jgi:DNA primase/replicative DNA helicase
MSDSIFSQIKERVALEDYLVNHLNTDLVPNGPGRMAALCPFHDELTPSFKVTDSDEGFQYWRCYGACQTGGTVIDAVMKSENLDIPFEAVIFLNDLYNLDLNLSDESYKKYASNIAQTKEQIEKDRALMKDKESKLSKVAYQYLHNRGYDDQTIDKFELAVDNSQTRAGRLSIPIYDKTNHPISVANRALFDGAKCANCGEYITAKEMVAARFQAKRAKEKEGKTIDWRKCPSCGAEHEKAKLAWLVKQHPKYLFLGSFDKSHHLYNQFRARRFLANNPDATGIFLVEGYADVWAGHQAGHEAICSYNGAQISTWQAEEAAEIAKKFNKPVILIPDFDSTGHLNIEKNIRKLRAAVEDVEIDVVYGIDKLIYKTASGEDKAAKDLGEVLQYFGEEQVLRVLDENRWPAAEWQIRQIIEKRNARTGARFHSEVDQLRLVSEVLANNKSKVALDHLINYLAVEWERDPDTIRNWFYSEISTDSATSYQHLFKNIGQARDESQVFLKDDNVIPLGFDVLDQCFPGNGARPGQLFMALGKSGTGKTMLATQILANMAETGVRSVFFSLEQAAKSLFPRLVCQALDVDMEEAERLIKSEEKEDEELLKPVREIYKNMLIIDNVPTESREALSMTPSRIQAIVQEANLTHFKDKPANVIVIDHLGILDVDDDAPSDVKRSDLMAPGYIMQRLFAIAKSTNTLLFVLQQLPKEVPPGKAFGYDAGRGGSKQTDFCDAIFCIWRPEQDIDLDDEARASVSGQYKLALGKNRYGGSAVAHLFFDKASLRIMPPLQIVQPDHINPDGPVIDLDQEFVAKEEDTENSGDIRSPEEMESLASKTDPIPEDTQELLDSIGAENVSDLENIDDDFEGPDPALQHWFD